MKIITKNTKQKRGDESPKLAGSLGKSLGWEMSELEALKVNYVTHGIYNGKGVSNA